MTMELDFIEKLLKRFKRGDLTYLAQHWSPLSNIELGADSPQKKGEFIDSVLKKFRKRKPTKDTLAELDLLYLQKYSSKKLWKVYKYDKIPGDNFVVKDASQLERLLRKQISLHFDGFVHVRSHHGALWVRMSFSQRQQNRAGAATKTNTGKASVIYMIVPLSTQHLLSTTIKVSQLDFIMQAVLSALHGCTMEDTQLSGHHVSSLLKLVLNKHTKDGLGIITEDDRLAAIQAREKEEEGYSKHVHNENRGSKRRREEFDDSNFGPKKLPKLERIDYKLETNFKGLAYAGAMANFPGSFRCRVRFEGPNVLEGIRNLAKSGLAELPMKGHLGRIHTMARNMVVLRSKPQA